MLRLREFRPTNDKIVKIQLHPTHPWLVTADASDHISVIYELKAGGVDERRLVGAKLEKLPEGETDEAGDQINLNARSAEIRSEDKKVCILSGNASWLVQDEFVIDMINFSFVY